MKAPFISKFRHKIPDFMNTVFVTIDILNR